MLKSINVLALGLIMVLGACSTTKDDETPVVDNRTTIQKAMYGKLIVLTTAIGTVDTATAKEGLVSADGTQFSLSAPSTYLADVTYPTDLTAKITMKVNGAANHATLTYNATTKAFNVVVVAGGVVTGLTTAATYEAADADQGVWNDGFSTLTVTVGNGKNLQFDISSTMTDIFVVSGTAGQAATTILALGTFTAGKDAVLTPAGLISTVTEDLVYTYSRALSVSEGVYYNPSDATELRVEQGTAPATQVKVNGVNLTAGT